MPAIAAGSMVTGKLRSPAAGRPLLTAARISSYIAAYTWLRAAIGCLAPRDSACGGSLVRMHAPSRAHSWACSCTQRRRNFRRHSWLHSVHMPCSFCTARMVWGPRPFRFSSHALRKRTRWRSCCCRGVRLHVYERLLRGCRCGYCRNAVSLQQFQMDEEMRMRTLCRWGSSPGRHALNRCPPLGCPQWR